MAKIYKAKILINCLWPKLLLQTDLGIRRNAQNNEIIFCIL